LHVLSPIIVSIIVFEIKFKKVFFYFEPYCHSSGELPICHLGDSTDVIFQKFVFKLIFLIIQLSRRSNDCINSCKTLTSIILMLLLLSICFNCVILGEMIYLLLFQFICTKNFFAEPVTCSKHSKNTILIFFNLSQNYALVSF